MYFKDFERFIDAHTEEQDTSFKGHVGTLSVDVPEVPDGYRNRHETEKLLVDVLLQDGCHSVVASGMGGINSCHAMVARNHTTQVQARRA